MIPEIKTYKTADLVLQVNKNYDPARLDLAAWDRYLDLLCDNRQYQKESIQKAIIYLASGLYHDINALAKENWEKSLELQERYKTVSDYEAQLQLPGKLAGTIDLATGTGKSYVMYGIAQIMLSQGLVDRVLVLCPSLTIEAGLLEKFRNLAQDSYLLKAIPSERKYKNPAIKSADVTIKEGDICIENIHAVYDKTGSSIKDSFWGQGQRTLVLNDEAHHIYNTIEGRDEKSKSLKKWKEFLQNDEYGFKYILGFTGTAYIDDEYFNDVIYRYSLREAVNDFVVKSVDYVSKNDDADDDIKFQEIYDNHVQNRNLLRKIKPLTILVTKDIKRAKELTCDLVDFLAKKEQCDVEEINKKVLIVTSANEHKANVRALKDVDKKSTPIEWIVSVSMLTEGWDVKNVFQIVPWEDRAFNSKLLIAQVLGRGLRVPLEYQTPQQKVRVFNHDAWSRNIKALVDEILEIEMKLISNPLQDGDRDKYHFDLYQIDYTKEPKPKISDKKPREFDYTKGFIVLQSQVEEKEKEAEYTDLSGKVQAKNTLIQYNTCSIDEVVQKILQVLQDREWEGKVLKLPLGDYAKDKMPPREELTKIIRTSMDRVGIKGDRLIEKNKIKIENSFNTLLRKMGKTTVYEKTVKEPFIISTQKVGAESLAVGNLRRTSTVFYSSNYSKELSIEQSEILNAVIEDESFLKSANKEINTFLFKTPLDIVFTRSEPERKFVERLCKQEMSLKIEAWIKSRDSGFYKIDYSITSVAGKHSKTQSFNPDFFIKIKANDYAYFIVVEIKADNDDSDENKAKYKYAKQHFSCLNAELESRSIKQKYYFHFLSPTDYDTFFKYLDNGELIAGKFRGELEDKLEADSIQAG
jgi:type III restriction enzyme